MWELEAGLEQRDIAALIGADDCLIPFDCDDFSRQALYKLLASIDEIRDDHNESLVVEGIVVNQFQSRAKLPRRLVDELLAEAVEQIQNES